MLTFADGRDDLIVVLSGDSSSGFATEERRMRCDESKQLKGSAHAKAAPKGGFCGLDVAPS
jgi:hypothetical protein